MNTQRNEKIRTGVIAAVSLLVLISSVVFAGHCCNTCPKCDYGVCEPVLTEIGVKKHCWQVECKPVCIPAFKWWWEPCCEPPPCGKVRNIKTLKKVEYECKKCGYKWEATCVVCGEGKK
jgi:hypothetical protein